MKQAIDEHSDTYPKEGLLFDILCVPLTGAQSTVRVPPQQLSTKTNSGHQTRHQNNEAIQNHRFIDWALSEPGYLSRWDTNIGYPTRWPYNFTKIISYLTVLQNHQFLHPADNVSQAATTVTLNKTPSHTLLIMAMDSVDRKRGYRTSSFTILSNTSSSSSPGNGD